MKHLLTKSDFKVARDCPAKLYYKRLHYPATSDDDAHLRQLAKTGYLVERIAQLQFPDGEELRHDLSETREASEETRRWIERTDVGALFEAVVIDGRFLARIDILHKEGERLQLIEVKSTSLDGTTPNPLRGSRGGIRSDKREYVEDVTFQAALLRQAFPDYHIDPYLCVLDTSAYVDDNCVLGLFSYDDSVSTEGFGRPHVGYHGDPSQLRANHPLLFLDVRSEVDQLTSTVWSAAEEFAQSIGADGIEKLPGQLGPRCAKCEYRYHSVDDYDTPGIKDGFLECWGELARVEEHLIDLNRCSSIEGGNSGTVESLVADGHVDLREIDPELLSDKLNERQSMQFWNARAGTEFLDPKLPRLLEKHPYPLHFIDFEAARPGIPYYPGMRPYEQVAFQWSCHTIREPGGSLEHAEWISTEREFPNFTFAETLSETIREEGTIYVWSSFERTALREIAAQLAASADESASLADWLKQLCSEDDNRVVDMEKLAKAHYFHPLMKGYTSIKKVLPAVLHQAPSILDLPGLERYRGEALAGTPVDPYEQLPSAALADGTPLEPIRGGTGAIAAYEDVLYGKAANDASHKAAVRDLLLQYCELDTAAMVMIWERWRRE